MSLKKLNGLKVGAASVTTQYKDILWQQE
jgi:hypothetical protein